MPMTWDADADARLFAAVLATSEIKIDYTAVAARMGNGCTAKAVTHRVTNIKNKAKSLEADGDAAPAAPPAANGSRKRGPKAKTKPEKANDSEDEAKPAAKKRKTENGVKAVAAGRASAKKAAPPPAPKVKKEEEEDSESGDDKLDEKEEDSA
ncbi:uncharacterized protein PV07_03700 [Cladophialophora immunda]|uniref:AT hook motif protein n=1 Tax=Cladophialophora immunda TaxID=569365 RepID=A0A0D2CQ98_9EURO|nr:uncharacterized protein PV07_03700 [Cladophialophora immunda]KIW32130.1 hypothetical protein PV07_03700 [Cladophialophora immunda]